MSLIYPRPTKTPFKPEEIQGQSDAAQAGKLLGCMVACIICGIALSAFFAAFLHSKDHFVMFLIGAGIPFLTSLPFIWK